MLEKKTIKFFINYRLLSTMHNQVTSSPKLFLFKCNTGRKEFLNTTEDFDSW